MAYRETIIADSPAGYYRLDEASGTAFADASGNSNTLTLSAATMISYLQSGLLTGDTNKAISSDGSGPFTGTVASPPTTLTGGFTFEGWFNCTALPGGAAMSGYFIYLTATPTALFVQLYSTGTGQPLQIRTNFNAADAYIAGVITTNTRYFLTVVYDTNYLDVYIDNVRQQHIARSSNYSGTINTFEVLGHNSRMYNTKMDEFAYYTRALTTDEIAEHYGYGNGSLIDPKGDSRPILRPRFDPTTQSIHRLGL